MKNLKIYNSIFLMLMVVTVLIGCGFAPHTVKTLPPKLHQVYLQFDQPSGQFETCFKRKLQECGVLLLANPGDKLPIMYLTSNYSYSNTSPISSAQGRIYTLTYTASISISVAGEVLLPAREITVSKGITLQPNEIFEVTPQVDIVKQELLQELFVKILNVLSAKKTFQVLKTV